MKKLFKTALLAVTIASATSFTLTGCTFNYDSENRRIAQEGTTYETTYGIIISSNPVTIKEQKVDTGMATAAGAIGGAVAGGIIGYNSHHVSHNSYQYRRTGHTGSDAGGVIGGLIGLGAGMLIGNMVGNSINNVDGLRLNVVTIDNQKFSIDVPKNDKLISGAYIQIDIASSGYTQVTPITKEAYEIARSHATFSSAEASGAASSSSYYDDDYDSGSSSSNSQHYNNSSSSQHHNNSNSSQHYNNSNNSNNLTDEDIYTD